MSKEKLEQENREYDTQIKNLNKEMEQMRKDLVDVQKLNRDNNRRFSQLSKQINTMQKDINSYNKSISNREEGYDDLAKQEVSLVTKLEKKKMQFDSLEKQIAENKKKMEDLEKEIDTMEAYLPPMTHFVLPGGHPTVSFCHIARTVCRRAERIASHLNELEPFQPETLLYINRLSDYLFVLARKLTLDNQAEEIPWIPQREE